MQNQGFIIAREGFKFIAIGLALTLLSIQLGWMPLAWVMAGFTIFVTCFFRNPKRHIPQEQGLIIAPADGKICQISEAYEKRFLREPRKRISIFMSVFNCHINRSPISGKVTDTHYHPGKFHIASVDKASDLNEQNAVCIEGLDAIIGGVCYVHVSNLIRCNACREGKFPHTATDGPPLI